MVRRSDRFPSHRQTDTFFPCLCRVWQGKATKEEDDIKEMLLFLEHLLWAIFHSHFCVASRKKVAGAGQEVTCAASVDCAQVLDRRLSLSILLYQTKKKSPKAIGTSFFVSAIFGCNLMEMLQ